MGEIIDFKRAKDAMQNGARKEPPRHRLRVLIMSGLQSVRRFVTSLFKTFTLGFLFVMNKMCKKFTKLFAILTIIVAGVELLTDKVYWPSINIMLILTVLFLTADTISNILMKRLGGNHV